MVRRSSSSSGVPAEIVPLKLVVLSSVRLGLVSVSLGPSFVVDVCSLDEAPLELDGYRTRSKPANGERSRKALDFRATVALDVVEAVDGASNSGKVAFGVVAQSSAV